jgi:hypothetical protein
VDSSLMAIPALRTISTAQTNSFLSPAPSAQTPYEENIIDIHFSQTAVTASLTGKDGHVSPAPVKSLFFPVAKKVLVTFLMEGACVCKCCETLYHHHHTLLQLVVYHIFLTHVISIFTGTARARLLSIHRKPNRCMSP